MNEPKRESAFEREEQVLKLWQDRQIFTKSLEQTAKGDVFSFYDGPPFITGTPHYGTLLPTIAKDVIPRYQTMKGKYVRRIWGWDTHGLPAENQVEKQLGLKVKTDIEKLGIDKFIAECRKYVQTSSEAWKWYVDHIGRWVDMENAYRTDSLEYMESVMWVFKQLYEKDLIYRGRRTSLYCPRCATPLSKFEVTMDEDSYRDVEDPAVTVAFRMLGDEIYLLAWTTTPWTLPANLALAVDKDAEYVKVTDGKKQCILAHEALPRYSDCDFEILETFKGRKLIGEQYEPLYSFLPVNEELDYKIYDADFVTMTEGTGIVHVAPGFGEDDSKLGEKIGLSVHETINDEGHFIDAVKPWAGQYYKKANPSISADLTTRGLMFKEATAVHSYPHCWRCATPLIYKAQVSWYMKLDPIREQLLKQNKNINWTPKHFGDKRFAYNIANAPDWSLSRTRYWGSPIPVWETEDGEIFVPGSIAELEKMSGQKITDLHRPAIDEVVLTLPGGKKAHRVKEVLDVWFESGSMPYAQDHYPFASKEVFERHFPTDFIIEYTGQLRGWFYYLHVLANALKGENAFKNVVVTGVLMGNDGRKMSKSYGNYPDPRQTIEKYGAESLRLYFMGSKIMSGEDPAISEDDIRDYSRLLGVLHNSLQYYLTYASAHKFSPAVSNTVFGASRTTSGHGAEVVEASEEERESRAHAGERGLVPGGGITHGVLLDRWILLRLAELKRDYSLALDRFDLAASTQTIRPFIEDLSTWYIRRSRERFVAGDKNALSTLRYVLFEFAKTVAPTLPFSAETIYQALGGEKESVHLESYPIVEADIADEGNILDGMIAVREIASTVHMIRSDAKIPLRQPLSRLTISSLETIAADDELVEILQQEANVEEVVFDSVGDKSVAVGNGKIELDTALTPELKAEGHFREILRQLQSARKQAGLIVGQKAALKYFTRDDEIEELFTGRVEEIKQYISLRSLEKVADSAELKAIDGEQLSVRFVA